MDVTRWQRTVSMGAHNSGECPTLVVFEDEYNLVRQTIPSRFSLFTFMTSAAQFRHLLLQAVHARR